MDKTEILDFSGKTVIVTGGTRGLGRVISESFLDAGANVVTCARNAPEKPIFSQLNNKEAIFFETDVRNPDPRHRSNPQRQRTGGNHRRLLPPQAAGFVGGVAGLGQGRARAPALAGGRTPVLDLARTPPPARNTCGQRERQTP